MQKNIEISLGGFCLRLDPVTHTYVRYGVDYLLVILYSISKMQLKN